MELEREIAGLAVLDEPVRRSLYFYVGSRDAEVSRDEAAQALGITRTLAGFHLDRLAEEGLLDISFRRLSGRAGPGAGRPAKLYRRSGRQLAISLPPRAYELAARILAGAIDESRASPVRRALEKAARTKGRGIGAEAKAQAGARPSKKRLLTSTLAALVAQGYEPGREGGEIRLRNCPFHALVGEHRELVCGMNLALVEGVIDGLGITGATPVLDPKPGMCCVAVRLGAKERTPRPPA